MLPTDLRVVEFAFPGPLRDQLVAAIVSGAKTTTTGVLADYERDGEPLPRPGQREIVIDSAGQPVTVIETVGVRVIRLGDVDLAHALGEGEEYTTVAGWRAAHERFWHSDQMREAIGDPSFTVDDETLVVALNFRVVGRAGRQDEVQRDVAASERDKIPGERDKVTAERNKDLVVRLIGEVWNAGDLKLLPELWVGPSRDEAYSMHKALTGAFPDLRVDIEDLIAEADKVVARMTYRGTHQGPFRGIAPTGRQVAFTAIRVYRVEDGKIVESWASQDALGLLRQLQQDVAH